MSIIEFPTDLFNLDDDDEGYDEEWIEEWRAYAVSLGLSNELVELGELVQRGLWGDREWGDIAGIIAGGDDDGRFAARQALEHPDAVRILWRQLVDTRGLSGSSESGAWRSWTDSERVAAERLLLQSVARIKPDLNFEYFERFLYCSEIAAARKRRPA